MAALSDPRAFLSAQEKRAQQMKAMGIEETDINTKDLQLGSESTSNKKGSKTAKSKPEEEKKGKLSSMDIESINVLCTRKREKILCYTGV